jgi:transposase-like protein
MVTPLTQLTEPERAQALERFHLLRPFLEGQVGLLAIAQQHHRSLRTLRRWVRRYETEGLTGLVRKRLSDSIRVIFYARR